MNVRGLRCVVLLEAKAEAEAAESNRWTHARDSDSDRLSYRRRPERLGGAVCALSAPCPTHAIPRMSCCGKWLGV